MDELTKAQKALDDAKAEAELVQESIDQAKEAIAAAQKALDAANAQYDVKLAAVTDAAIAFRAAFSKEYGID